MTTDATPEASADAVTEAPADARQQPLKLPWEAERLVSPALAVALIERQFPDLAPASAEPLGSGWDNTGYRVNSDWVFRFPRKADAVAYLEQEGRVLPRIAGRLPLPVPLPERFGQPSDEFPWPFLGYRHLAGRTACAAALDPERRTQAALPLAEFLVALHGLDTADSGAGPDAIARTDFARRRPAFVDRLAHLAEAGLVKDSGRWLVLYDDLLATSEPGPQVLVHGDLYVRHVLVDGGARVSGVIDWGDVHVGSAAIDLAIAHVFLPPRAHDAFRDAYGPVAEPVWRLAKLRALNHSFALAWFGRDTGDADIVREALLALDWLKQS